MNRRHWLATISGLAASLSGGCGDAGPARPTLRVAAASDLQHALPVLIAAFRQEHGAGLEVVPTFGSSGQLSEQIRQGAPFNVFLSADRRFVEKLAEEGSIDPKSVRAYARGTLVLAVHDVSDPIVKGLADLSRPEVKTIAMANPEVAPYGRAAKQTLERAGLWESLGPKIVPADSVRQALQFVELGNADVAFVGRSIADVKGIRAVALPPDSCDPIIQVLGVTTSSGQAADARAFADFVMGEVGQGILHRLGFSRVSEEEPKAQAPGPAGR